MMRIGARRIVAGVLMAGLMAGLVACSPRAALGEGADKACEADGPLANWKRPDNWDEIVADEARLDKHRAPRPTEFGFVFSYGYGGEDMPEDTEKYEELLKKVKAAGYNIIHTQYTDENRELCRKYGIKMMLQFLDVKYHHVYKSPDKAEAVAKKVEGDPIVWGYNIWNDIVPKSIRAGRIRDIRTVRKWDPSHPAYLGEYRRYSMHRITNGDCPGYYDFHWSRGIGGHFGYLNQFRGICRANDSIFYSWFGTASGAAGEDNFRKNLWSTNTGIAFGLKGVMWFLSDGVVKKDTLEYGDFKDDIQKIHERIPPALRREIMKIGMPEPVCGTTITKNMKNEPVPAKDGQAPQMPNTTPIPADFWAQPRSGEFVMGLFKHADGSDVLYVANYNALAEQKVRIALTGKTAAEAFDIQAGNYTPLPITGGEISFDLEAGGGKMLKFRQ